MVNEGQPPLYAPFQTPQRHNIRDSLSSSTLVELAADTAHTRLQTSLNTPPPLSQASTEPRLLETPPPPPSQSRSMTHLVRASPAKTILYVTTVHELRSDNATYSFSIDRVYHSLTQANTRLHHLARCNALDIVPRETCRLTSDPLTDCHSISWTPTNSNVVRFHTSVHRLLLQGPLATTSTAINPGEACPFPNSDPTSTYVFHATKDLPNHIWAIAIHDPSNPTSPLTLPWTLNSLHPASGNALAHAKHLYTTLFTPTHGRACKTAAHYGHARFILAPSNLIHSPSGWDSDRGVQIRVERVAITPLGEMATTAMPGEVMAYDKLWRPLCPARELGRRVQEKVDEVLFGEDLSSGEEGEAVRGVLRGRGQSKSLVGRTGGVGEEEEVAVRPWDFVQGGVVEKAPVGRRGLGERGGVGRRMRGWLYHVMQK